jgi:hypothetical protein
MNSQAAYLPVLPMESSDENREDSPAGTADARESAEVGQSQEDGESKESETREVAQSLVRHGKTWIPWMGIGSLVLLVLRT